MNEDDNTASGDTATGEEEKRVAAAAATAEASWERVQIIHPTIRPLLINYCTTDRREDGD